MSQVAETLKNPRATRGGNDDDPDVIVRRTRNARLHLRKLAEIAPKLDKDDFNEIRDALAPVVETWNNVFAKSKKDGTAH